MPQDLIQLVGPQTPFAESIRNRIIEEAGKIHKDVRHVSEMIQLLSSIQESMFWINNKNRPSRWFLNIENISHLKSIKPLVHKMNAEEWEYEQ